MLHLSVQKLPCPSVLPQITRCKPRQPGPSRLSSFVCHVFSMQAGANQPPVLLMMTPLKTDCCCFKMASLLTPKSDSSDFGSTTLTHFPTFCQQFPTNSHRLLRPYTFASVTRHQTATSELIASGQFADFYTHIDQQLQVLFRLSDS